jgi:hypothetical protein
VVIVLERNINHGTVNFNSYSSKRPYYIASDSPFMRTFYIYTGVSEVMVKNLRMKTTH